MEHGGRAAVGSDEERVSRGRRKHLRPCPRRCGGPMHLLCTQGATPCNPMHPGSNPLCNALPAASIQRSCVRERVYAWACAPVQCAYQPAMRNAHLRRYEPGAEMLEAQRDLPHAVHRMVPHMRAAHGAAHGAWCMAHGAWRMAHGAWRLAAPMLHTTPRLAPLHMGFTWSWPVARCFTPCIACPRIAQRATSREHHMLHHTSL